MHHDTRLLVPFTLWRVELGLQFRTQMLRKLFRLKVLIPILVIAALIYGVFWFREGIRMPGKTYSERLDPLDPYQERIRDNLKTHVETLAISIGPRNLTSFGELERTADYIRQYLLQQEYVVSEDTYEGNGRTFRVLYTMLQGTGHPTEPFVVGAHYDTVDGSPGADDNASGVATVLELARTMKNSEPARPIIFAFFPNEEPPYFQTKDMGSLVFAKEFHHGISKFAGMIAVEAIGYYSDQPGSQKYPIAISSFYPKQGNFIGFVGDTNSRELLKKAIAEFRLSTHFPSEGASVPTSIEGVGWSDHWSFWQVGVPAIMVTDTAPFRYPFYHRAEDTPDKLDFDKMARVTLGLKRVLLKVAE